ncbi:MAG: dihydropteroate synthase, partial [Muribaculaceae bacterium]|nr:dihydropteroate synthase [Muribaculaceae bacterium]
FSSRPGAVIISAEEEYDRLAPVLETVSRLAPDVPISVDTFRASVAKKCIDNFNVDIINDISGGNLDAEIIDVVAELKKVYILMHSRGTPETMQSLTSYDDLVTEIISELAFKIAELRNRGFADIIVDPGFGFAKTTSQNFTLLKHLSEFKILKCPILSGISRKSMIWKTLGSTPEEALNGTTVLNTVSLMNGADIIRVHDVAAARECVLLVDRLHNS